MRWPTGRAVRLKVVDLIIRRKSRSVNGPGGTWKNYKLSLKKMLVGAVGIEPTTFGLKGRCSTTELRP